MKIDVAKQLYEHQGKTKLEIVGDVEIIGSLSYNLAVLADPGDAGTIAPPESGADFRVDVTTVGAGETRVLGIPTRVGQTATIRHAVAGGTFTMLNASGWQGDGVTSDIATFGEVEDTLIAIAVGTGAVTDWRYVSDKGVVLG